ncbi:MAG: phosphate starvation-inducible protein PhoH, partial [Candidatus Delongbacteria bacterium]|nr:phosphate starvation-inducible protein PhoH [Candidatus Delongbacteria bacterium]
MADPLVLLGTNDRWLRLIEREFYSSIVYRDNRLLINGPEDEVKKIKRVFEHLLLYIQNKQAITKTEVFYAIDRAENEEKIELKHLFSDELTMESLKTRIKPKTEGQGQYIEA